MALSASSPRRIASSLSKSVTPQTFTGLTVDKHQHLRALEPGRNVAGRDFAALDVFLSETRRAEPGRRPRSNAARPAI